MKTLPLHDLHESHHAHMGEFGGYAMPLYYTKPIDEHHTVRREVGAFDISHMGIVEVRGERAEDFLQYALTNDMRAMTDGGATYSPLCRQDGGVLDDLIVYRYDTAHYRVIVNAGTREKDVNWLLNLAGPFNVRVTDRSDEFCLFAVQGPKTFERLMPHLDLGSENLRYYTFADTTAFGVEVMLARTGYTGEPGYELAVPTEQAHAVWDRLTGELDIAPIGLAARDTLRLEAAMPLYGHELREEWNPLECGLGFAVKLDVADDFVGKAALREVKDAGPAYRSVALKMTGRGIPRDGYAVHHDEAGIVGEVTSGTQSPTLGEAVALARVRSDLAARDTPLAVEIRGRHVPAVVVRKPFYKNPALRD